MGELALAEKGTNWNGALVGFALVGLALSGEWVYCFWGLLKWSEVYKGFCGLSTQECWSKLDKRQTAFPIV